jgi:two-component system sensor histidine kinase YesM
MRTREYSLRRVLFLSLTLSCLFPLVLTGGISYLSLKKVLESSVVNSIRAAVRQNRSQADAMVSVLDSITQLAVMEFVSEGEVERYVAARSAIELLRASGDIKKSLTLLSFANPDIGLIVLYDLGTGTIITQSAAARENVDIGRMPVLLHRNTFTAFGPSPTLQRNLSDLVFSAARLIPNSAGRQLYLYFEMGRTSLGALLDSRQYGISAAHVFVSMDGFVTFSQDPAEFPPGSSRADAGAGSSWYYEGSRVIFPERAEAGWRMLVTFPRREFDGERMRWLAGLLLAGLLSLSASLLIALFIWRILYMPLNGLRAELASVGGAGPRQPGPAPRLRLREYSWLSDRVAELRDRIAALIEELTANEARKRRLEVEQLLFQINPHFLYNTLNNVQWLARINGQQEISRIVADLNKVLHYNLRRTGETASVRDEVDMLGSYVAIQKRRLDLHLDLRCEVAEDVAELPVPRFILQPLVENAIQHGARDSLSIGVSACRIPGGLRLQVKDNGAGMTPEKVREVLAEKGDGTGGRAGLGIRYVRSLIDMVLGGRATLRIESSPGCGTTVTIDLPAGDTP